ncbi:MAG: hypothetical protein ABRQ37_24310 [Candidatus Eremiobacterota bacterium]
MKKWQEARKGDRFLIEELIESRKSDRKILANLEANQIFIGKAMEGIHE